ncbi:hypothetical protein, partial [Escherichia coli]
IGPDPRNFNQRVSLGRNDLLIRTFLIISLWLQIKHIIFLCVPFLRKPYFMRIMSRQKSINKRASQCG